MVYYRIPFNKLVTKPSVQLSGRVLIADFSLVKKRGFFSEGRVIGSLAAYVALMVGIRWNAIVAIWVLAVLCGGAPLRERPIPEKNDERKLVDFYPSSSNANANANANGFLQKQGNMEDAVSRSYERKLVVDSLPLTYYPASSYASGFTLTRGNLVGVVSLPAAYTVSFDLYPTEDGTAVYRNIVHLTANASVGYGACDAQSVVGCGSRLPGFWFNGAYASRRAVLTSVVSGSEVSIDPSGDPYENLPVGNWSTVTFTLNAAMGFFAQTVSGGVTAYTVRKTFTSYQQTWPSVYVYVSDPWEVAAAAKIRNLVIAPPAALPVSYYPASSYADGYTLSASNLLGVVSLPAAYTVSFDLYPTAIRSVWSNIIHLSATGGDMDGAGCRMPAVMVKPDTLQFEVSALFSGTSWLVPPNGGMVYFELPTEVPQNAWFTVTITLDLSLKVMTASVTGYVTIPTQSATFVTPNQQTWSGVQLYASDPFYVATAAKMRNLVIAPPAALPASYCPASSYADGFTLSASNLLGVVSLPSSYLVSFDLYPTGNNAVQQTTNWLSILALTATGSIDGYTGNGGDRLPMIFLCGDSAAACTLGNVFVSYQAFTNAVDSNSNSGSIVPTQSQWTTVTVWVDAVLKQISLYLSGAVTAAVGPAPFVTPMQTTWPSVSVWATFSGQIAAAAKIRNLAIAPPAALPASYYPASSYADGFTLTQGNLLGVVSLPATYMLSFDLYPTAAASTTVWQNIIHLTATNGENNGAGAHLPALYFPPQAANLVTLTSQYIGSGTFSSDMRNLTSSTLTVNTWYTVLVAIHSVNKIMTMSVSGESAQSVDFPTPSSQTWSSVQVFASNPFSYRTDITSSAKIRNLVIIETTESPTATPTATPTASPTVAPTVSPTASPTVAPTVSPTARPTALPTRRPTMLVVRPGAYVYNTLHPGPQCRSPPAEFSVDSLKLNQCLPSDVGNPRTAHAVTWQQTDAPHRFSCSVGQRKFSVINTQYAAADSTCSREPTGSLVSRHDYLCSKDPATGMFRQTHCGHLASTLANRDSLVLKVYNNERCTADSKTRGYLLGVCNRMYDPVTKSPLDTFAKLALALTYTQGAGNTGSSRWAQGTVVWIVEQQVFKSESCAGVPVRTAKAEYASDGTCKQDLLRSGSYYTLATLASAASPLALGNPTWLFDP